MRARVLFEGLDEQVEEPGAYDRAFAPRVEDLGDVVDHVDLLEELEALGVGLHHGVLDAVVNHLGEVPGTDTSRVHESGVALGLQCVEDRLDLLDVLLVATGHQRIAVLEAPHASADTAVDVADALFCGECSVLLVVGPTRVATVDDDVALVEQLQELFDS